MSRKVSNWVLITISFFWSLEYSTMVSLTIMIVFEKSYSDTLKLLNGDDVWCVMFYVELRSYFFICVYTCYFWHDLRFLRHRGTSSLILTVPSAWVPTHWCYLCVLFCYFSSSSLQRHRWDTGIIQTKTNPKRLITVTTVCSYNFLPSPASLQAWAVVFVWIRWDLGGENYAAEIIQTSQLWLLSKCEAGAPRYESSPLILGVYKHSIE